MDSQTTAHEASENAAHKAKSAQFAVELAREAQQRELVEQTALKTKEALLDGLKEVFGEGDSKDPSQMTVLIRRVPILCTNIEAMHQALERTDINVAKITDNQTWVVRIIVGAVAVALLKLVLIP